MECQKTVELRTLSDEESRLLFKSRAGNVVESLTMNEVAWNVAKECAGLPPALVVFGTALKGKKLEVWKTVLKQLKKSTIVLNLPGVSNKVCQSIELSYNFLESEAAKWCFLHCCLYPEDYHIYDNDLMHMLVGGGLWRMSKVYTKQVHVLMDRLKASCLLLDAHWKSYARMHDVESPQLDCLLTLHLYANIFLSCCDHHSTSTFVRTWNSHFGELQLLP